MIQCKDCEFYKAGPDGSRQFLCDPFTNIKEPECLQKWQLLRLDMLLGTYNQMVAGQKSMEPLQKKMIRFIEREVDDMNEADEWKLDYEDEDEDEGELL